jgi:AcrR family transcriptional regulator
MNDVSECARVSRGTLYRYFKSREELLESLAGHEMRRFEERVREAVRRAPNGPDGMYAALNHAALYVRDHPAIRRILETDPAVILTYLRDNFAVLRSDLERLLGPLFEHTRPVRTGAVTSLQLVDWSMRLMISALLFPDPQPDEMARGLNAIYGLLTTAGESSNTGRRRLPAKQGKPIEVDSSGGARRSGGHAGAHGNKRRTEAG